MDVPADTSSEFSHDPNGDDVSINTQDSGTVGDNHNADWGSRLVGVESDDLQGARHSSRQSNAAAARRGHRRNVMGSLGTDPDVVAGDGSTPFTFQLDDGRVQGGTTISSPLNWMSGGGADDPEGVHKRSLNGTSKGVSPGSGVTGGVSSPHDGEGFSIRRVACDEHSSGLVSQQPAQVRQLLCVLLFAVEVCCIVAILFVVRKMIRFSRYVITVRFVSECLQCQQSYHSSTLSHHKDPLRAYVGVVIVVFSLSHNALELTPTRNLRVI